MLVDLVLAQEGDIQLLADSTFPGDNWDAVDIKGIDPVKWGKLQLILTPDEDLMFIIDGFEMVGGDEEEGPFVIEVPLDVIEALAPLKQEQLGELAAQWCEAPEMQRDGYDAEAALEALTDMQSMCEKAMTQEKLLFLWMSV